MSARLDRGDDRGVSLVELLTVIAISTVLLGAITTSIVHALQTQQRQTAQVEALNEAKIGFERVTRDLRAADPLRVAEPDLVRLDTRLADGGTRTVTYTHDGDALRVADGDATPRRLVDGVVVDDEPVFRFHLTDGTTSSDAVADTRMVHSVTVRLRVERPEAGEVVRLDNRVLLRNQRP